jgi:hypothetical protein
MPVVLWRDDVLLDWLVLDETAETGVAVPLPPEDAEDLRNARRTVSRIDMVVEGDVRWEV